jgi:HSP20 family protein
MANISRWDPFNELTRWRAFEDPVDNLVRRFLQPSRARSEEAIDIAIEVTENDKSYSVKAEMPGVRKEDISVSVDGNVVSISAEVKKEKEDKDGEKVLRSERYYGVMSRSFSLPTDVDQAKAEAKCTDGVLELTLPKRMGGGAKRLAIN